MAQPAKSKNGKLLKTILLAAASTGLYTALFANEPLVVEYYTKGHLFAALPVVTAFAFSFVHGAFANEFLETVGLTARVSQKPGVSATKQKQTTVKKDQRPRLNVS